MPHDFGGWGRHQQGDALTSEASAPGAHWTSQLDPSHPPSAASPCDDVAQSQRNQASDTLDERRNLESENSIRLADRVESGSREELAAQNLNSGPRDLNDPENADERNPRGDEPKVPRAAVQLPAGTPLAKVLAPMDKSSLALLTDKEIKARRSAMFQAKRKLEMGH
jgi:hypothetical protein